ncbi:disease resistance protein Roq1 [Cryptomeria japonica]|uniref:disease resistance protein Roq1 n=1 Tax=Cryptomeria japonica TaxID=3369 RepID=UPI0027DA591C|nr:disease resistance protein Roq1 [Cryptomeria japonica]
MGGSGKTTLAKEVFNRKKSDYFRASFLFDVREASERRELPSLQLKLLKDLFHRGDLSFTNTEEGTGYLKDSLEGVPAHLSFLIVIDDIDHVEQLNALLVMDILKELSNSLVIVTTRDVGVLINVGITDGYHLKGMNRNYGSELFCWHAFDQPNPSSGYKELVNSFVDVCGGLPLSLQVLGRHVHGRSEDYWRSELIEVRKTLPRDVKQRLRISFDALNAEEKQVFMDIACFFVGRRHSVIEEVWEGSGWNAQHALETLRDKCLIEEETNLYMRMHDHLRDLGREMALEFNPPHHLWRPRDLKYLELMSFRNILNKTNVRCFHSIFDKSMNYQVTFFLGQSDICVETSASLLWLQLEGNSTTQPMKSIPSWIPLQSLQCLKIKGGRFKTLWENHIQVPSQLKKLDITYCGYLISLSGISYIEKLMLLNINQCPNLKELTLGHLSCLEWITIVDCKHLKDVLGISNLAKLVKLEIYGCTKLEFECLCLSGMKYLESITFDINVKVKYFMLDGCPFLKKNKFGCANLVELSIRSCPELEMLPAIRGSSCIDLRITIDRCGKHKYLQVYDCPKLRSVSLNLEVTKLHISNCPELKELPGLSRSTCLEKFEIDCCKKLKNITLPTSLISLSIQNCRDLQRLAGISDLTNLTELHIMKCPKLEELASLSSLNYLERTEIDHCKKLQNITLPTTLISLSIQSCRDMQRVAGINDLTKLTELYIIKCPALEELLSLSKLGCLEQIMINSCDKMESIAGTEELHALKSMQLFYCSNAIIQNCIPKLETLQSDYTFVIGRAVDVAETTLNEYLFYDNDIGADAITEIVAENSDELEKCRVLSKVIICILVVVDSSTSVEDINESIPPGPSYYDSKLQVRPGEWMITMVEPYGCWSYYYQYYMAIKHVLKRFGILKKGFLIEVKKDEEWKGVQVLHTIIDKLYHL